MKKRVTTLAVIALAFTQSAIAQLEEITVTAQFKEQSLQDTGIAIDALDTERLIKNGVTSSLELAELVPALTITEGGGIASSMYMRGVGNSARNNYLDPAIILTYDGVPIARSSAAALGGFYDLERVEVMKGPQGTLYGKNATGGVMSLVPAKPVIGETIGYVGGFVGSYEAMQLTGALNLPVGENSALRISGAYNSRDGYSDDGTNDDDRTSFRIQFLTDVSDNLSIRLAADTTDIGGVGNSGDPIGQYAPNGLGDYSLVLNGVAPAAGMRSAEGNAYRSTIFAGPGMGFLSPVQDDWFTDATLSGVHAEINYDTDIGLFTVIPAWRKAEQESRFNGPGFNSGWWDNEAEQTTLEARLQGEGEMIDYLVGAFYFTEETSGDNTFNQEFVLPTQLYDLDNDSWAVFTQLTFNVTDTSRLITGVRYTEDERKLVGGIDTYVNFCGGLPPNLATPGTVPSSFDLGCHIPGNIPHYPTLDGAAEADEFLFGGSNPWASVAIPIPPGYLIPLDNGIGQILHNQQDLDLDYSSDEVTWRIAYEQDILDDSLFFASFEKGYRAGGLEPNGNSYDPEYIDAYTIGMKNRLLDGQLQLNLELFMWDYTDQQISYFSVDENGALENRAENVGKATNQGIDIDLLWAVSDNTLISSKLQVLDNSYDELHFTTNSTRDNINCPFTGTPAALDFDCSGNQSIYSPDLTVQFGVEHTVPLNNMDLVLSLDTTWTDDQVTGFQNLPHEFIEAHSKTNIDVMLTAPDGGWSVGAYVRNLEDERRVISSQSPLLGMAIVTYGPDMTYGVRFGYDF